MMTVSGAECLTFCLSCIAWGTLLMVCIRFIYLILYGCFTIGSSGSVKYIPVLLHLFFQLLSLDLRSQFTW